MRWLVVAVSMMFGLCINRGAERKMETCRPGDFSAEKIDSEVIEKYEGLQNFQRWFIISGCGQEAICSDDDMKNECYESPVYEVAVDRLSLETGCDKRNVTLAAKAQWSRSLERAYRLNACGSAFVCGTAPGQPTTCKAALTLTPQ